MNDKSELELLREFARHRTEASFNELVQRQIGVVYSTALRLVADPHWAEDISQSVFTALAQQADSVVNKLAAGATLAGWLHLTTRNIASKTVRTEVRRRTREQEAMAMQELDHSEDSRTWERLAAQLDHTLGELLETDRDALLLRFFEGKSSREIGRHFGVSEEAAQKRVSRALERLRERFLARGVVAPGLTATALADLLSGHAVSATPAALTAMVAQTAFLASATLGPAASGGMGGILSLCVMTKSQIATLLGLGTALLIPFEVQRLSIRELQTQLATAEVPLAVPLPSRALAGPPATSESEAAEMARLRRQGDELRAQLVARRSRPPQSGQVAGRIPGPCLLSLGKPVRLNELGFAGNATPEAAFQSLLTFRREGDLDGALRLMLFSPERTAALNELLASPEARAEWVKDMAATAAGAVVHSAVRVSEDGSASEPEVSIQLPESDPRLASVEIVAKENIDERRVQLTVQIRRGNQTNAETQVFGLTGSGWKGIE